MNIENLPQTEVEELNEAIDEVKKGLKVKNVKMDREIASLKNRISYLEGQVNALMSTVYHPIR